MKNPLEGIIANNEAQPSASEPEKKVSDAPNETLNETLQTAPKKAPEDLSVSDILSKRDNDDDTTPSSEQPDELDALKKVNIDDIKDPQARAFVERRVKELESGVNRKFEEIAEKRKELEARLAQTNQPWTTERVEALLNDQNFVGAVQTLQSARAPQGSGVDDDDWSNLSDREKQIVMEAQAKANSAESKVNQLLQSQEDSKLMERYPGYDPKKIDQTIAALGNGSISATRETIYRAINYEDDVKAAYRRGLKDRNADVSQKADANLNLPSMNVNPSTDVPDDVKKSGIVNVLKYHLNNANRQ